MATYNHLIATSKQAWQIFEKFLPKETLENLLLTEKIPIKIYRIEAAIWMLPFCQRPLTRLSVWAVKISQVNYCGLIFNSGIKNEQGKFSGGVFIPFTENDILYAFRNNKFVSDYVYIEKSNNIFRLCQRFVITNSVQAWNALKKYVPKRKLDDVMLVQLNHNIGKVNFGWAVLSDQGYKIISPLSRKIYDVRSGDIIKFYQNGERVHPLYRLRFKLFYYLKLDHITDKES